MPQSQLDELSIKLEQSLGGLIAPIDFCGYIYDNRTSIVLAILDVDRSEWQKKFKARRTLAGFDAFDLTKVQMPERILAPRAVLHVYPEAMQNDDTALTPHTHFYDFFSTTIGGEICHTFYEEVEADGQNDQFHRSVVHRNPESASLSDQRIVGLSERDKRSIFPRQQIYVDADTIHSVSVIPDTVTITVEAFHQIRDTGLIFNRSPLDILAANSAFQHNRDSFQQQLNGLHSRLRRISQII